MSKEVGCKVWAESCITMKDGKKYYVDNTVENIERKRTTDDKIIRVELTTVIADKIKEISILKSDIEKVEPIKLRRQR